MAVLTEGEPLLTPVPNVVHSHKDIVYMLRSPMVH